MPDPIQSRPKPAAPQIRTSQSSKVVKTTNPVQETEKPKSSRPVDTFQKTEPDGEAGKPAGFGAFVGQLAENFGKGVQAVGAAASPIYNGEPKTDEAKDSKGPNGEPSWNKRQRAAGTMDKLAGEDGVWDKKDIPRNLLQVDGFGSKMARKGLLKAFDLSKEDKAGLSGQIKELRKSGPIEDKDKIKMGELLGLNSVSNDLRGRLGEAGLPVPPEGEAVNAKQYRGLLEGQSPLKVQADKLLGR